VPEIVAAVKDCTAAAGANGVSEKSLLGAGWSRGTMEKDGKAVEVAMSFYGKAKTNPMIMTDAANGKAGTVCFVTARFSKVTDYQQLINAVDALDNTDPLQRSGADHCLLQRTPDDPDFVHRQPRKARNQDRRRGPYCRSQEVKH
jgi:hypothetical protein